MIVRHGLHGLGATSVCVSRYADELHGEEHLCLRPGETPTNVVHRTDWRAQVVDVRGAVVFVCCGPSAPFPIP